MDYLQKMIVDFEIQSLEGIKICFENGVDPNTIIHGQPLIYELINMYSRGPLFKECIKIFVENGLIFEDKILLSVLMDDAETLDKLLTEKPEALAKKYTFKCSFTPIYEATLLHVCAEYNHVDCAKILVKHETDINAKAGIDENGFGGQTPIFHTVNQNKNLCLKMMHFLIAQNCDLEYTIKGLVWGKGYEWETFIPAINPVSYAMMGLLPQFQRTEQDIYVVVSALIKAAYNLEYSPKNVPNKYLET